MPLENFLKKLLDSVFFTLISYLVNVMLKIHTFNKKFMYFPLISVALADLFVKPEKSLLSPVLYLNWPSPLSTLVYSIWWWVMFKSTSSLRFTQYSHFFHFFTIALNVSTGCGDSICVCVYVCVCAGVLS